MDRTLGLTSLEVPVPAGHSPFGVSLGVLQSLVEEHGGVVVAVDVRPDGTASYTVSIPAADVRSDGA